MEKHNIIIILDNKITEIDATDSKNISILTFYGEDDILLKGIESLDEAKENILEKFSLETLTDIELNIIIINNGTSEKSISYLYGALSEANSVNIIDASVVMRVIANLKKINLPIKFHDKVYCSVNRDDTSAQSALVEFDDLLFLFHDNVALLTNSVSEFQKIKHEYSRLQAEYSLQKTALQKASDENIILKEQLKQLQNKYEELQKTNKPITTSGSAHNTFSNLMPGSSFVFGRFFDKPIKWRVLKKQNNELLVIATQAVSRQHFGSTNSYSWSDCDLRKWLNEMFYQSAFSSNEKTAIKERTISTSCPVFESDAESSPVFQSDAAGSQSKYSTNQIAISNDKVFLLSQDEASLLFKDVRDRAISDIGWHLRDGVVSQNGYINSNINTSTSLDVIPAMWVSF